MAAADRRPSSARPDPALVFARAVTVDQLLDEALAQIERAVPCDGCAIFLADTASGEMRPARHHGAVHGAASAVAPEGDQLSLGAAAGTRADGSLRVSIPGARMALGEIAVWLEPLEARAVSAAAPQALESLATHLGTALERARATERMAEARELRGAAAAAAGIAQELRAPLSALSSAAQLLRFSASQDPVVERNVGRVLREVEHLNALAAALLEFAGPGGPQLRPGDPDAVWDAVLASSRGVLESRGLLVRRSRSPVPARAQIDVARLTQMFGHLLGNAADAAPEGSDIELVSELLPDGTWHCRLHNDGAPIPSDLLRRVFDIFVSTKPEGTGLGLPLSRRIIQEHGGSIALESGRGQGTTVAISLPAAPAARPTTDARPERLVR